MLIGITVITFDTVPLKTIINSLFMLTDSSHSEILSTLGKEQQEKRPSAMSPPKELFEDEVRPRQSTGLGECNTMSQHKSWVSYPIASFQDSHTTGGLRHQ